MNNRFLDSDFTFVLWTTWVICILLVVLLILTSRRPQPPSREPGFASGRHRAKRRLGLRQAHLRYGVEYPTELTASRTLLPYWGPTAPCPHDDWTRTLDVIVNREEV